MGQPVPGHIFTNSSRLSVLLMLGTILFVAAWLVLAKIVVPPLIQKAYQQESLPLLNHMISGQAVHPVGHYLKVWDRITYLGILVPFVFSLIILLTEEEHVRAWASSRPVILISIIIMIHLVPLWAFTYFPSQDGPVHLNIANVLRKYYSPNFAVFREYYALNKNGDPNWFIYLILASLMYIVSPLTAEKILLSCYIILLPISALYALRAIRPTAGVLVLMVHPFLYNNLLHMGFYNFSFSLAMFFFVLGYWLRYRKSLTFRRGVMLAILSLVLYLCHLVSLIIAYLVMVLLTIVEVGQEMRKRRVDMAGFWEAVRQDILPLIYALVPACVLAMSFLDRQGVAETRWLHWSTLMQRILNLRVLVSYDPLEIWCARGIVGLFSGVAIWLLTSKLVQRRATRWDGLLIAVIVCFIVYFVAPDAMSGGSDINIRLSLYPFLVFILWVGAQSLSKMTEWRMSIYALGISVMFISLHSIQYARLNDYLMEYLSGSSLVGPNTTLLALAFSQDTGEVVSGAPSPFLHASGYIAARRNFVALSNYQPTTGYFPITFRRRLAPPLRIALVKEVGNRTLLKAGSDALQHEPPDVDFVSYHERTGGSVDYVLVWDVQRKQQDLEATRSIFRQLRAQYELIYTSPQRGLMQLYRWKQLNSPVPK